LELREETEKVMRRLNFGASILATVASAFVMLAGGDARSDSTVPSYAGILQDQAEVITSPQRLIDIASSGSPMAIWQALEHGEKVECLECVTSIAPLLYASDSRTREISAWWLRRRIFGVFGQGQVYQQTLTTLQSDSDPVRRSYAAYALGEFLVTPGIAACATAITSDADARVRAAAASALGRLNDDGTGALSKAITDSDESVRLAAIVSAGRVNSFTDVATASTRLGDSSANVRRRALMLLDEMRGKDAIAGVLSLVQSDPDVDVRIAASHALGNFGDASARPVLTTVSTNDASSLVRDMALIALRQL
jgi:HEAT repeat protein